MLSGEKILITGAAGQIGYPMARFLAKDNEVWGLGRFGDDAAREKVAAAGIVVHRCDLEDGSLAGLPEDFTYVIHLAALMATDDYDRTLTSIGQHVDSLLTPEGIVVAEHGRKMQPPLLESYGPLHRYRVLEQGDAGLSFYGR